MDGIYGVMKNRYLHIYMYIYELREVIFEGNNKGGI